MDAPSSLAVPAITKARIDSHLKVWADAGSPRPPGKGRFWTPVRRQTAFGDWVSFRPKPTAPPDTLFYGVRLVLIGSIPSATARAYAIEAILANAWIIAEGEPEGSVFQGDMVRRTLDGDRAKVVSERGLHHQVVADDGTVEVLVQAPEPAKPTTEDVPYTQAVGRTMPGRPLPIARIWVDPRMKALVWSHNFVWGNHALLPLNPDGTVTVLTQES